MSPKKFSLITLVFFIAISLSYFIAIEKLAVPKRVLDRTYRQFLLSASNQFKDRVIIYSGSNSMHSIDGRLLEKLLGRLVINISDNGGYPLEYKIYALKNNLHAGDIVILPLEWHSYFNQPTPIDFVKDIFEYEGLLSFYYWQLPLYKRFQFVFSELPFLLGLQEIAKLNALKKYNKELALSEQVNLNLFFDQIKNNYRGEHLSNQTINAYLISNRQDGVSCDQKIMPFYGTPEENLVLPKQLLNNLKLLQDIAKKRQVKFIFTWPAVVAFNENACYESTYSKIHLPKIAQKIKNTVEGYGFTFVGEYLGSRFDQSCFKDSCFHIRHDCAKLRTKDLAMDLIQAGLVKNQNYDAHFYESKLHNYLSKFNKLIQTKAPIELGQPILPEKFYHYFSYFHGWHDVEHWGSWSSNGQSSFAVNIKGLTVSKLIIKGHYFLKTQKTKVVINGVSLGKHVLENKEFDITKIVDKKTKQIRVELEHVHPISPLVLGLSTDERKIEFGLASVEFR